MHDYHLSNIETDEYLWLKRETRQNKEKSENRSSMRMRLEIIRDFAIIRLERVP